MRNNLIILLALVCIAGTGPRATTVDPADIRWNSQFRSVTDAQIKFWNKPTVFKAGTGVRLTQLNDSTILITGVPSVTNGLEIQEIPPEPPVFTNNAAALKANLQIGDTYRTGDALKIVHK